MTGEPPPQELAKIVPTVWWWRQEEACHLAAGVRQQHSTPRARHRPSSHHHRGGDDVPLLWGWAEKKAIGGCSENPSWFFHLGRSIGKKNDWAKTPTKNRTIDLGDRQSVHAPSSHHHKQRCLPPLAQTEPSPARRSNTQKKLPYSDTIAKPLGIQKSDVRIFLIQKLGNPG